MDLDESKPLIHNEHLYKSMVGKSLTFFQKLLDKYDDLYRLESEVLMNPLKIQEIEFYFGAQSILQEI